MPVALLQLHLHIPDCHSLKEKRSRLKPLLARLHREFNVSAAEMDLQDVWQETIVACALVSSDAAAAQRHLQGVLTWLEHDWPDVDVVDDKIEML